MAIAVIVFDINFGMNAPLAERINPSSADVTTTVEIANDRRCME